MCDKNQKTTTTNQPPAYVSQAWQNFLPQLQQTANTPLSFYQGQIVAPFSQLQNQGFAGVPSAATAAQPDLTSAQNLTQAGTAPVTPTAWSPSQIQQYMDPYTQNVINSTQQLFNMQNAQQQSSLVGNAASQGALGGDRVAVAQAQLAGQQQAQEAPVLAGLEQSNFQQATGEFNTQQQTDLAAQQANAYRQLYGAGELGNLGELQQGTQLTGAQAELSAGAQQQAQTQAGLNVPYEEFLQAQQYPFYTTGFYGNELAQMTGAVGGTGTTIAPGPSPYSELAGLGLAAYGASSLYNSTARGGRIPRRADGGPLQLNVIDPLNSGFGRAPQVAPMGMGHLNVPRGGMASSPSSQSDDPMSDMMQFAKGMKAMGTGSPGLAGAIGNALRPTNYQTNTGNPYSAIPDSSISGATEGDMVNILNARGGRIQRFPVGGGVSSGAGSPVSGGNGGGGAPAINTSPTPDQSGGISGWLDQMSASQNPLVQGLNMFTPLGLAEKVNSAVQDPTWQNIGQAAGGVLSNALPGIGGPIAGFATSALPGGWINNQIGGYSGVTPNIPAATVNDPNTVDTATSPSGNVGAYDPSGSGDLIGGNYQPGTYAPSLTGTQLAPISGTPYASPGIFGGSSSGVQASPANSPIGTDASYQTNTGNPYSTIPVSGVTTADMTNFTPSIGGISSGSGSPVSSAYVPSAGPNSPGGDFLPGFDPGTETGAFDPAANPSGIASNDPGSSNNTTTKDGSARGGAIRIHDTGGLWGAKNGRFVRGGTIPHYDAAGGIYGDDSDNGSSLADVIGQEANRLGAASLRRENIPNPPPMPNIVPDKAPDVKPPLIDIGSAANKARPEDVAHVAQVNGARQGTIDTNAIDVGALDTALYGPKYDKEGNINPARSQLQPIPESQINFPSQEGLAAFRPSSAGLSPDETDNPFGLSDKRLQMLEMGLGMMASPSHFALQGIGEGALTGIKQYQEQKQLEEQMRYRQALESSAYSRGNYYDVNSSTLPDWRHAQEGNLESLAQRRGIENQLTTAIIGDKSQDEQRAWAAFNSLDQNRQDSVWLRSEDELQKEYRDKYGTPLPGMPLQDANGNPAPEIHSWIADNMPRYLASNPNLISPQGVGERQSPQAQAKPAASTKAPPGAIAYLKAHPETSAVFDQHWGKGAAKAILEQ